MIIYNKLFPKCVEGNEHFRELSRNCGIGTMKKTDDYNVNQFL